MTLDEYIEKFPRGIAVAANYVSNRLKTVGFSVGDFLSVQMNTETKFAVYAANTGSALISTAINVARTVEIMWSEFLRLYRRPQK